MEEKLNILKLQGKNMRDHKTAEKIAQNFLTVCVQGLALENEHQQAAEIITRAAQFVGLETEHVYFEGMFRWKIINNNMEDAEKGKKLRRAMVNASANTSGYENEVRAITHALINFS